MYNKISRNVVLAHLTFNCIITVGATGAVTSYIGDEITSVTKKTDNGEYEFLLNSLGDFSYVRLLNVHASLGGSTLEVLFAHIQSDTLASDRKLIVQMLNTSAAVTNVTSGNTLHLTFEVECSKI
jgi:hypothetical protein